MNKRLFVGGGLLFLACVVWWIVMHGGSPEDMAGLGKEPCEAREWFRTNPSESALAGNRFVNTAGALGFAEKLYAAGAVQVTVSEVSHEPWQIELEGDPYADALIVELPADRVQRSALFRICDEEASREGFAREVDSGQREILLWWD